MIWEFKVKIPFLTLRVREPEYSDYKVLSSRKLGDKHNTTIHHMIGFKLVNYNNGSEISDPNIRLLLIDDIALKRNSNHVTDKMWDIIKQAKMQEYIDKL